MLDDFDARRRPLAVVYDRWRTLPAAGVPPLFSFDAYARRAAISAARARAAQHAPVAARGRLRRSRCARSPAAALNGTAGLQVGRMGPPMREWQIAAAPGAPWTAAFTLPVDASFVGLRTTPEFESSGGGAAGAARARRERRRSAGLADGAVGRYLQGCDGHLSRRPGVRRARRVLGARTVHPARHLCAAGHARPRAGRATVAARGRAADHVRFETATWGTTVALVPGVPRELLVPALPGQTLLPVRITTESGFVPADTDGGSDRRLLGCWIEVLE